MAGRTRRDEGVCIGIPAHFSHLVRDHDLTIVSIQCRSSYSHSQRKEKEDEDEGVDLAFLATSITSMMVTTQLLSTET
jgi:hypothetical protein